MNGKLGLALGIGVGLAAIGGLLYLAFSPVDVTDERTEVVRTKRERAPQVSSGTNSVKSQFPGTAVVSAGNQGNGERRKGTFTPSAAQKDWFEDLPSAKDRAIAKRIQSAIDNNDLAETREAAKEALAASSPEVRLHAVDALGWFGQDALLDLTSFLKDKDPEVAKAAFNAWDSAVDMMDNDGARVKLVGLAMKTLTDKDSLAAAAAKIEACEDRKLAVNTIIDIIESGNKPAANAAKEAYEFLIGEPYKSAELARGTAVIQDFMETHAD